jgi:hypothetical protein
MAETATLQKAELTRPGKGRVELYVPITRATRASDGKLYIEGIATAEVVDNHGTIIDVDSIVRCMPKYMQRANLREMHDLIAAGKVLEWDQVSVDVPGQKDQVKGVAIRARVSDESTAAKIEDGTLTGLSFGMREDRLEGNRLFVKRVNELSVVDAPSCDLANLTNIARLDEGGAPDEEATVTAAATVTTPAADPAAPDAGKPAIRVLKGADVIRSLWDAKNLVDAIGILKSVAMSVDYEAFYERDGKAMAADATSLREAVMNAVRWAAYAGLEMFREEYDELMGEGEATVEGTTEAAAPSGEVVRAATDDKVRAMLTTLRARAAGVVEQCDRALAPADAKVEAPAPAAASAAAPAPEATRAAAAVTATPFVQVQAAIKAGDLKRAEQIAGTDAILVEVVRQAGEIKRLGDKPVPAKGSVTDTARVAPAAVTKTADGGSGAAVEPVPGDDIVRTERASDLVGLVRSIHGGKVGANISRVIGREER